jgi:CHAD domain-containing protein
MAPAMEPMEQNRQHAKPGTGAADPSYRLLACQYVSAQLDALVEEMRGVRENKDPEPVHQMRVASRRLRAALGMFAECFDPKKTAAWRRRLRRLTRGLGAARDLDVQIAFVQRVLAGLDAKDHRRRPGVERLLLRLRQDRDAVQPKVVEVLDALNESDTLADMHGEVEKSRFLLRTHDVPLRSPVVLERAAAHILRRKGELLAVEPALSDLEDIDGHHQVRIATKRIRYTMEICVPAFGKQLDGAIGAVKKVQSLLGDVHDCDVWVRNLTTFIEEERNRTVEYFGHARPFHRLRDGLEFLRDERARHRQQVFAELLEHWQHLCAEGFWEGLEALLQPDGAASASPQVESQDEPIHGTEDTIDEDRAAQ